ncbi:MAG: hypothetical protein K2J44_03750, partial [Ruminococcus sp.]|nr:hypothetical protein [Ruminococcus sp.]
VFVSDTSSEKDKSTSDVISEDVICMLVSAETFSSIIEVSYQKCSSEIQAIKITGFHIFR